MLQNRWEAATIHWACQFAGIVITPINWRAKADEVDYCIENSEAKAVVFEDVSADAVRASRRGAVAQAHCARCAQRDEIAFADSDRARCRARAEPRVGADAWSVMLYTSGTTAKPKGVPRRQRAERAAALAHVAQNLYGTASARSA